jgi:hypothetical protein
MNKVPGSPYLGPTTPTYVGNYFDGTVEKAEALRRKGSRMEWKPSDHVATDLIKPTIKVLLR